MRFFETLSGYRYDRILFYISFSIILFSFLFILYINNFNIHPNFYARCEEDSCKNPYYQLYEKGTCQNQVNILWVFPVYKDKDCLANCDWCSKEYLSRGVYGRETPLYVQYFGFFAIGLFILTFIFNHWLYNKGKLFDIELCISKTKRYSLIKMIKKFGEEYE